MVMVVTLAWHGKNKNPPFSIIFFKPPPPLFFSVPCSFQETGGFNLQTCVTVPGNGTESQHGNGNGKKRKSGMGGWGLVFSVGALAGVAFRI